MTRYLLIFNLYLLESIIHYPKYLIQLTATPVGAAAAPQNAGRASPVLFIL